MAQDKYSKYKNYLFEIGGILKERGLMLAQEVRRARQKKSKDICEDDFKHLFKEGQLLAFYVVVDWMYDQAELWGIPLKDLQLEDIIPDRDLA